jgi:GNAT superfamily N-acetyltransferase
MPVIDIPTYELKEITFDQIFPVWNEKLWPGRKSKIEPMSSLVWESKLFLSWGNSNINKDSSIFDKYEPTFFGLFLEEELVGVNSGFRTEDTVYRSRGLWVSPEHRGLGYGQFLLGCASQQGKRENCKVIWSMPRKTALSTYENAGFNKIGPWLDETVEFGPNAVAYKYL